MKCSAHAHASQASISTTEARMASGEPEASVSLWAVRDNLSFTYSFLRPNVAACVWLVSVSAVTTDTPGLRNMFV